jgi:hypothetical protein
MSLSYSNLPVYVGAQNTNSIIEADAYIPSTQANVSLTTANTAKRLLGRDVTSTDQFRINGPLGANISFSCFLDPVFAGGFDFMAADRDTSFFPIQIGGNLYKNCYLSDYSISVAPYVPVTLSANFVSLTPASGEKVGGDANPYGGAALPFDPDDIAYGHTCTLTNMTTVVGSVQSQINYRKTFSRTPIYTLGSTLASSMILDSVESQMSITSTGLGNLIDFNGTELSSNLTVNLLNVDGDVTIPALTMTAGAKVLTQGYNVNGGDTLSASATIKEINL